MDTIINNIHPIDLILCIKIRIETLLNVLYDRPPRVIIVHKITKTWRVNDSKTQSNAIFFDIGTDRLDRDCLGDNI